MQVDSSEIEYDPVVSFIAVAGITVVDGRGKIGR